MTPVSASSDHTQSRESPPAQTSAAVQVGQASPPKELPKWLIAVVLGSLLLVTAAVLIVLLWQVDKVSAPGAQLLSAQLDAVKIAASVAIGGGGLFALYLAVRRQRAIEADLRLRDRTQTHNEQVALDTRLHQERVAEATELDALERRLTDLYAKAVEQFGSENPVVRLGGLYALERLAQNTPHLRRTVVEVICAYLRLPYSPPRPKVQKVRMSGGITKALHNRRSPALNTLGAGGRVASARVSQAIAEADVRQAAQRLLRDHFRMYVNSDEEVELSPRYWGSDVDDLNLSGATLVEFDVTGCTFPGIDFVHTEFIDGAYFDDASFQGYANFRSAYFSQSAFFRRVTFRNGATFLLVNFDGLTEFDKAVFGGRVNFAEAAFQLMVTFGDARACLNLGDSSHIWPDGWATEVSAGESEWAGLIKSPSMSPPDPSVSAKALRYRTL